VEPKRRLPLLKAAPSEAEETPVRPAWQWVVFGALGIFVVLIPLSWLATLAALRMGDPGRSPLAAHLVARAAPFVAAMATASLAGGYLVGRWGTRGVGVREAALAGLAAALGAGVLAWGAAGALAGAIVTVVVSVPSAALGGRLGLRRRR
jgi:hypothetical protein